MKVVACPFIGLKDDNKTALNFASKGNYCHRISPPASITGTFQTAYCLTSRHVTCPVFLGKRRRSLASILTAIDLTHPRALRAVLIILFGLLICSTGVTAYAYFWDQGWLPAPQFFLPQVPTPVSDHSPANVGPSFLDPYITRGQGPPTATAFQPDLSSASLQGTTIPPCSIPDGWSQYTVNPTDSIEYIALVYKIGVDDLLAANCMDRKVIVRTGQIIYVPNIPTASPNPTDTNAPIIYPVFPTDIPRLIQPIHGPTEPAVTTPAPTTGTKKPSTPIPPPTPTLTRVILPTTQATTNRPTDAPTAKPTKSHLDPTETPYLPTTIPTTAPTATKQHHPKPTKTEEPPPEPTIIIEPTNTRPVYPPTSTDSPKPTQIEEPTNTKKPTRIDPTESFEEPTSTAITMIPTQTETAQPTALPTVEPQDTPTQVVNDTPTSTNEPVSTPTEQPETVEPSLTSPPEEAPTGLPSDTPEPALPVVVRVAEHALFVDI